MKTLNYLLALSFSVTTAFAAYQNPNNATMYRNSRAPIQDREEVIDRRGNEIQREENVRDPEARTLFEKMNNVDVEVEGYSDEDYEPIGEDDITIKKR